MEYFIGIVPPEEIKNSIIAFRKGFFDKDVVEPHITIKAQSGLTEDKSWLPKIERYIKTQPSFAVKLGKPETFGGKVLFLSVVSNEIEKIHKDILEIVNPDKELRKKYHELGTYVPHLTLGQVEWGIQNLTDMESQAKQELIFPEFKISFVRVYEKSGPHGSYVPYRDIALK